MSDSLPANPRWIGSSGSLLETRPWKCEPKHSLTVWEPLSDLIWRLLQSFPNLDNPTEASGVVLIDELDIHLHPSWQREIAGWLQEVFPNLQFFVATHSPLIAAGAGEKSLTLRIDLVEGELEIVEIPYKELAANVDRTLTSSAFGLKSTFPTETENKIKRYHQLNRKNKNLAAEEKQEYEQLSLFVREVKPFGEISQPNSLESRIDALLEERLSWFLSPEYQSHPY